MEPRLHARRVAVIRERGRRRLRLLLAAIAVLTVVSAAAGAAFSPLLDVDRVRVHGVTGPRAVEVRAASDVTSGEPLLFLDLGNVAERVERLGWVERADVARHLPGTLAITVVERAPVAWASAVDGTIELIDRRGAVLATAPAPPAGVPQLGYASPADRAVAARVARTLPPAFRPAVVSVVATDGQVALGLNSGVTVRLGAPTLLEAKVRAAEAVLVALGGAPVAYIDVRVPGAPVTG